ncbi:hypothetical protein [Hamadaea tsunoensis]|uniref:hypothetical protein n=1 Tax=Hamadaea tsunoensis TaxID=53368 RepID=UPI000415F426|nr:hypothetical protein [Hamadaea tsunoensis]
MRTDSTFPAPGGPPVPDRIDAGRNWWRSTTAAVRRSLPTAVQIVAAAALAILVALLLGLDKPIGAPLFAVTTIEFVCARHRRSIATFFFGLGAGLAIAAVASGYRTLDRIFIDLLVGVAVAMLVAFAANSRNGAAKVNETLVPLLNSMTINIRSIAGALRTGDAEAAKAAVYALADTDDDLRRLREVLLSVRRSAVITLWTTGQDLEAYSTTAREIGYAVRNTRVLARHAWWGVLHGGEQVPRALPPMLEALADGISLMRDEIGQGDRPKAAQPQLISAARWIDVMRGERLGLASAAVAADADAAVLNLLIATGIPLARADALLNHAESPAPRPIPGLVSA